MLEQFRDYLMCRMATKREAVVKWIQLVGPRILKIVEKNKTLARLCHAKWAVVNLSDGSCSCKRFQLIRIPCGHALVCIFARNYNFYNYINSFYKKEAYEKTYAPVIYPMPHPNRWPNARQHVILPLIFKKMSGIPKKLRKREPSEPPASNAPPINAKRFNIVMHCRNCEQLGHYYSGCKEPRLEGMTLSPPRKSRKKVNANGATTSHQPSTQPRTCSGSTSNVGAQSSTYTRC
ncbi:hypothetical protein UlMin_022723 [Ulmus minor]